MATATQNITPSQTYMQGGSNAVAVVNEQYTETFGGVWVAGDTWTFQFTDTLTGLQTQVGDGFVTDIDPTFCLTYNDKVYMLAGNTMYASAIDGPTIWNDPNASGNGFIQMVNQYSSSEDLVAMAVYQGKLAFFSAQTVYIWNIDANLANWSLAQTLPNIGTLAPKSVASLGDLDVVFLNATGIRSLRARDITLNAFVNDIGSPIDALVQNALLAGNGAAACSVVEPTSGRYMLLLNGIIYVLSYYPSNKIQAWSTYTPVDDSGKPFVPSSMGIYQGQVWFYGVDSNNVPAAYQYGGANNNTYDATKPKWQTGFLDAKTPGTVKTSRAIDCVINAGQGGLQLAYPDTWDVYVSMDQKSVGDPTLLPDPNQPGWTRIFESKSSSFDIGTIPYNDAGTHFSVYAVANGDGGLNKTGGPATFSEFLLHYEAANEKG